MTSFTGKGSALFVILMIRLSKECAPPPPDYIYHYQNKFCVAKYVMVGRVESTDDVPFGLRRFRVRVHGIVIGFRPSDVGTVKDIYTTSIAGSCGAMLRIGTTYAIGSNKDPDGRFFIMASNFIADYYKMTEQQQMYMWRLRGKLSYKANCRCTVSRTASDSTCHLKLNDSCYYDKAICSYNARTKKCEWVNDETC